MGSKEIILIIYEKENKKSKKSKKGDKGDKN